MKLLHHASAEFQLEPRVYEQKIDHKPMGFWIDAQAGDELTWKRYIDQYEDGLSTRATYKIGLDLNAKIRVLSNKMDMKAFTSEYGQFSPFDPEYCGDIDWKRVAEEYQGILIAPFISECEEDPEYTWYWTWTISSGCIWDLNAISVFELS